MSTCAPGLTLMGVCDPSRAIVIILLEMDTGSPYR